VSTQGVLPGCEEFFAPEPYIWKPKPHILERVKGYFLGYVAHGKAIRCGRKHMKERLGLSIRTISRYIAYLVADSWITTVGRTTRAAIRKVLVPCGLSAFGTPPGTCIEGTPEAQSLKHKESMAKRPRRLSNLVRGVVDRATRRINAARNPAAYRQAIISAELRLEKLCKPPKPGKGALRPRLSPRQQERLDSAALQGALNWLAPQCPAWEMPL
jgi:hypothetical protein